MFRKSGYLFAGLFGAALVAFWPSYLSKLGAADRYMHLHAALMTLWCALLVAQPFLVRAGRRPLHRALGRASFVLVPAIVAAAILLAHSRSRTMDEAAFARDGRFLYLPAAAIGLFVVCWALAIRHRKTPALHARYMIATGLTLIDPVVARLLFFYFPPLPHELLYQAIGYGLTLCVLGALLWRDRAERIGRPAFQTAFVLFTVVYGLWFTFGQTPAWAAATRWFRDLPLT